MSELCLAVTQMACGDNVSENVDRAESLVRQAAEQGAQIILLQELFETPYFPKEQLAKVYDMARPAENHPTLERLATLAKDLAVVLPLNFFERANQALYDSVMIVDADGEYLGLYRKSHIPNAVGYQEKHYFNPGDTGFQVWPTRYATIGVGVCWDQWFPEAARIMTLRGAEAIFYPTAIGSAPQMPDHDSMAHWQRAMQGHAAVNLIPVCASNRIGREVGQTSEVTFYGSSFIAGPEGEIVAQAGRDEEAVVTARFDLEALRRKRNAWAVFRDRRPDLYGPLLTLDGWD